MKAVLLKNVSNEDWIRFKTEAAAHDMRMPEFFSYVLKEHAERESKGSGKLDAILAWRSGISKTGAEKLRKKVAELRRNFELKR